MSPCGDLLNANEQDMTFDLSKPRLWASDTPSDGTAEAVGSCSVLTSAALTMTVRSAVAHGDTPC